MEGESSLVVHRRPPAGAEHLLNDEALNFLAELHRTLEPERQRLLDKRGRRQEALDAGEMPDRRSDAQHIRESQWTVPPSPADLRDRRVEITGPTDRRRVLNALNSGANVYKADFEDANVPVWGRMLEGQHNLFEAVRGTLEDYTGGEHRVLAERTATLVVRPRGLHLPERAVTVNGEPVRGALFDFGLFVFHNAAAQLERGTAPYFYLPKLEDADEARWWREAFRLAEDWLLLTRGTIRATVLIEHVLAALQTDEILHALGEHAAGLNAGRWDYIFSAVKAFREHPTHVLPDRGSVTTSAPFMRTYQQEVVRTCHRRGAHAIGGMSALVPDRAHPEWTEQALAGVRADKEMEVALGFDGAWVAHPDLVSEIRSVFDVGLGNQPHQIHRRSDENPAEIGELLDVRVPDGEITRDGLDDDLRAALHYFTAWLDGRGAVNLDGKMEDTATAEIGRSQPWHWMRHRCRTRDGEPITTDLVEKRLEAVHRRVAAELERKAASATSLPAARQLLEELLFSESLPEFATVRGLDYLDKPVIQGTRGATR